MLSFKLEGFLYVIHFAIKQNVSAEDRREHRHDHGSLARNPIRDRITS
jgi:hypothetical protein